MTGSRTLIAYVTRSGNTRAIAEALGQSVSADLVEIKPASAYPADYDEHVAQSRVERDNASETPLAAGIDAIADYDVVFLGFPIWAGTTPSPIRTFLKTHDLRGKLLRPFITHGGYGIGDSLSVLAACAPKARIDDAHVVDTEQPWDAADGVRDWLGQTND